MAFVRRTSIATAVAVIASLVALGGAEAASGPGEAEPNGRAEGTSTLSAEVQRSTATLHKSDAQGDDTISVIATLRAGRSRTPGKQAIRSARRSVLSALPANSYRVAEAYEHLPAVSLEVDRRALTTLATDPNVAAVQLDHTVRRTMAEANALTGADDAHTAGLGGNGITVAIIDTGVDSDAGVVHPALADDLVGQACFRTENDCIGGPGSAEDEDGHGTHVAGIITGPEGVAPAAEFYALKVFTTGDTSDTNILAALDHVIGLNATDSGSVDLVNMSLGSQPYADAATCNDANPAYRQAFAALNAQGTTVFVSAGNDASTDGVGAPGCVDGAVGVGSTGDAEFEIEFDNCLDEAEPDKISCFSNTTPVQGPGELLDLLAPGCEIRSTWLDGSTGEYLCGTSMAAPYAAGTAALVLEHARARGESLEPRDVEDLLETTGVPIADYRLPVGAPSFPRVAPMRAIGALSIGRPSGLVMTATTGTSATLDWTGSAGAAYYRLTRTVAASQQATTFEVPAPPYTDLPVPCGEVAYTVQAVDAQGIVSLPSDSVATTARPCPEPAGGMVLLAEGDDTNLLSWTLPAGAAAVILQRRFGEEPFADYQTLDAGATSYADTVTSCGPVEYRVVVVAIDDRAEPSGTVRRRMCAPTNDDLADAEIVLPGSPGEITERTVTTAMRASIEPSDPWFSCKWAGPGDDDYGDRGFDGVWYSITPTTPIAVEIDTLESTLISDAGGTDTLLAVYDGEPAYDTEIACSEDVDADNDEFRSKVSVILDAGSTYLVHVAHWADVSDDAEGDVVTRFAWQAVSGPPNDLHESAAAITTTPYALEVADAQTATRSADDPGHACVVDDADAPRVGSSTLWWTFSAPADGLLQLDTAASTGAFDDTVLSVFTGSPGDFTSVGCNDDADDDPDGYTSQLTDLPVRAGATYSIMVSRYSARRTASEGVAALSVDFTPDPDQPEVVVSTRSVVVEEGFSESTYSVHLTTGPAAPVTLTPTSGAQCRVAPEQLVFTNDTHSTPQTFTVTADDDDVVEGDHACAITHVATSADSRYDRIAVDTVDVSVVDALRTSIDLVSPAQNTVVTRGARLIARYSCSDNRGGAGITACTGDVADGQRVDTSAPGSYDFTVTLTDVRGATTSMTRTYTVQASSSPPTPPTPPTPPAPPTSSGSGQPDLTIAKSKRAAKARRSATYQVVAYNRGTGVDQLRLHSARPPKGFRVKFMLDGTDITQAVRRGQYVTRSLAPGETVSVTIVVAVRPRARVGAKFKGRLTATSLLTPGLAQSIGFVTKRKR